ncbi:mechanosensitive ion channel domain-containing protein [Marinobacterium jannaschii]|uniref:mechanosensitive ion channel domain-containing protein n=1 Tax=Marinobacterium jannaschii TaxID=64970 RepID=UPI000B3391FE|nr:mechanosensitive ion channel domain-containing protein [Marinobacterium jannaschii]
MTKVKACWLACLALVYSLGIAAQDLPNALLKPGEASSSEASEVRVPEAEALKADWWRFLAESNDFESRVEQLNRRLKTQISDFPAELKEKAADQRQQIIVNLQALGQLRKQPAIVPSQTSQPKESYSIESWLKLESRYRVKKREVEDEQASVEYLTKAVESAVRQYDKQMAAYINIPVTESSRAVLGIDIMLDRSALELAKERLSRQRKTLRELKAGLKALLEEKVEAEKRIVVSIGEIPELREKLLFQEKHLSQAGKLLHTARLQALEGSVQTPEDSTRYKLKEQQVISAASDEAIARLNVAIAEASIVLTSLLANSEINLSGVRDMQGRWQLLIRETGDQLTTWQAQSLREQNSSQSHLLRQPPPSASIKEMLEIRNRLSQETLLKLRKLTDLRLNVEALAELCREHLVRKEGVVVHWWASTKEIFSTVWSHTSGLLTDSLFKIGDTPVTVLGLFRVILIVTIALVVSILLRRMLAKIAEHHEGEGSALYTVGRLAHYVILLVGVMIALSSIGLDFRNLALVAGALSVGIGFGLQSIVNNFVSGLILLFERSLKVGDFVELDSGVLGVVMEINVRSTLINTNDNVDIIVPNSELVSAKVTNWTLRDATRRMRIPFGVAYGTDKERVKTAVLEAAARVPVTLTRPKKYEPQVWLVGFGDSSLDFELVVWVSQAAVKRPSGVIAAYMWEIETSLQEFDIEIPFPQRDLHIRTLFEKEGEEAEALIRPGKGIAPE